MSKVVVTWVVLISICDGVLAIAIRVSEDDDANHAMILSILDLESSEESAVFDKCDFAFDLDSKLL
jgi:hypothetical protein